MRKEERNVMYPIYPPYGMNMGMMPGMPFGYPGASVQTTCNGSSDVSGLKEEIENLKKRVNYLENNLMSNYNGYNSSNYQVM
jgi:hypothetical protein